MNAWRSWLLLVLVSTLVGVADAHAQSINEGELSILTEPPDAPPHFHAKQIVLTADSLESGWVQNSQCLSRMNWWGDAVQIVFGKGKVRDLKITRADFISKSWVEGPTVQIEGLNENSELCLQSENRILSFDDTSLTYLLRVGPFMLRLFDGFFPMTLNMSIDYPQDLLTVEHIEPMSVAGIDVLNSPGHIRYQSTFEGVLWVNVRFRLTDEFAYP